MEGEAPLPFLRLSQGQRAMSGAGSPSAMSEGSAGGGGSAQHTPAGTTPAAGAGRPPCSPFAPAPRCSPRDDAAAALPPLAALKRSRSEASDVSGDSATLVPPPRPVTNKRYLSEVMSQNLARLKMELAEGGEAAQAAAAAAGGFTHGGAGAHLAHPDVADGLMPPEQLSAARAAWAAGSEAAAAAHQRSHAAPHTSASELLLRRSATAQLQPIQIGPPHGSRSAAVAAAESRLPPSPSDAAAFTDLRRAALLRALQRRTGSGSVLAEREPAAMSRSVEDSDVSMASTMSTGDEGEDADDADAPAGARVESQEAATPHAQPHDAAPQPQHAGEAPADGAVAWDDAPMSPPMAAGAALAAQAQPLPPELRLGPNWQLRG